MCCKLSLTWDLCDCSIVTTSQGLEDIPEGPRAAFADAFKVPKQEMAVFNKAHPPPDPEDVPKRKKAKVASSDQPSSPGTSQAASPASASKSTPTSKAADSAKVAEGAGKKAGKTASPAGKAAAARKGKAKAKASSSEDEAETEADSESEDEPPAKAAPKRGRAAGKK